MDCKYWDPITILLHTVLYNPDRQTNAKPQHGFKVQHRNNQENVKNPLLKKHKAKFSYFTL